VDIMVIEPQEAGENVRAGKLRVLAQISEKRLPKWSDVPTLKEAGFDITPTPQIRGVVAPPKMPAEAVAYWIGRFEKLHHTASWKKYVEQNELEDAFLPGQEFEKSMQETSRELKEQFVKAGIKVVR